MMERFNGLAKKDKIRIGAIVGAAGLVLIGGGFLVGRRVGTHRGVALTLEIFEKALAEIAVREAAKKVA
jgi:hypothetical protein